MSDPRPNIVLLMTDQQRFDTIAAAGFDHMITPNLDRLAREGCIFRNAFTPNPVCVPARHNMLTGLSSRYHGYTGNDPHPLDHRLPTLPRLLADGGYHTRAIGKMHFRPTRRHSGFDAMELMEEIPRYREDDEYAMYLKDVGWGHIRNIHGVRNLLYMAPQRSLVPEEHHGSTWVGRRSAEFIRREAGRRPFFLWSSWIAPHPPFDIPDSVADLYRGRPLPEPLRSETTISEQARKQDRYADLPAGEEGGYLRRMRECYFSAISFVDRNIGPILEALEETGVLDNTLIIFTSDHGEMLGDHGIFQKMLPYDSASRIPLLIRYPFAFEPGSERTDFVDLNDLLPTALDAAGIDYPGPYRLPGASLLPGPLDREYQYIEYGRADSRWISVRDARYKYTYYYRGGYEELFDMQGDPTESTNLLQGILDDADASLREQRDRLRTVLYGFEAERGPANYAHGGDFLRFPSPPRAAATEAPKRRNAQFPIFPDRIVDPDEKAAMTSFGEEVILSVEKEELVKLHRLDLSAWAAGGGPQDVIERIKREEL